MRLSHFRIVGLSLFLLVFIGAGCSKKPAPAPVTPPPPPSASPTATLTANPPSIERGGSSTLTWSTENATDVSIDPELGSVSTSGNRAVKPGQSTTYRLTAKGPGGSTTATARITVTTPPPGTQEPTVDRRRNQSEQEIWEQNIKVIYFDYDHYDIRDDQRPILQHNGETLRANASWRVVIEGHCDERGSAQYNLGLGQKRAESIKEFLVSMGIPADRVRTISYGKEKPTCTEQNETCWQANRRGVFVKE